MTLVDRRLIKSVHLIIKTTDLSSAGYALSTGSGGVAVSDATALLVDMLINAGWYFDPFPLLASPTTRAQLFPKDLLPFSSDARPQHRSHLGFWNSRYLSWKAWRRFGSGLHRHS